MTGGRASVGASAHFSSITKHRPHPRSRLPLPQLRLSLLNTDLGITTTLQPAQEDRRRGIAPAHPFNLAIRGSSTATQVLRRALAL